jgi:hypothetical protein
MKITTTDQKTRAQATATVEALKSDLEKSNYFKIANDETERTTRRNEANSFLAAKNNDIKRADDIARNTPVEAYTVISVTECFDQKDMLKANGYKWNPESRSWYKKVLTANTESEVAKIKA